MTIRVALVGCGAIGTVIARAIDEGGAGEVELALVYDIVRTQAERLVRKLKIKPIIAERFDEVIEMRNLDLVIEAASQDAVRRYATRILESGKDLMVMSVGALVDERFLGSLLSMARRKGRRIYVPSGAIAGLDGVKSATMGSVTKVVLTARKPPKSLEGAPFIAQQKIDLNSIEKPTLIYEGSAEEAVRLFPRNVNVVASLSLAGLGAERTRVRIVADPTTDRILHEIRATGDFGELVTVISNVPHPENPKTSYLAALSAVRTLRKLSEQLLVGT